ncbi:MAG: hypothetical protein LBM77_11030 [Spirochaetaceae bacterium]|jgi:hypothetical protein|nr:hypothetical protein [Spirochaetaceae bacterium]
MNGIQAAHIGMPNLGQAISMQGSGRSSLPVAQENLIYAQFKHVKGVAAPSDSEGVSINKLAILNTLIEQLKQARQAPKLETPIEKMNDSEIDTHIISFEKLIKAIKERAEKDPYMAAPEAPPAIAFDLTA